MTVFSKARIDAINKLDEADYELLVAAYEQNDLFEQYNQWRLHYQFDAIIQATPTLSPTVNINLKDDTGTLTIQAADITIRVTVNDGIAEEAVLSYTQGDDETYTLTDDHLQYVIHHCINYNHDLSDDLFIAA